MRGRSFSLPGVMALPLLAAGLLLPGCGQDSTGPAPCCSQGVIEGTVRGGEHPVAAVIRAVPFPQEQAGGEDFTAQADSGGHYALSLPQGRYRISAEFDGVLLWFSIYGPGTLADADTVTVSAEPVGADIPASALAVDVSTLPYMEGRALTLHAERAPGAYGVATGIRQATIAQGLAAFHYAFVAPGTYLIRMDLGEETGFYLDGTYDRERAVRLNLRAGREGSRHFFMDQPGRIRGKIRGSWQEMGAPPPRIEAHRSGLGPVARTTADGEGRFSLESFVSGPVRLKVVLGPVTQWIGGGNFSEAAEYSVAMAGEVEIPAYEESGILCRLEYGQGEPPDSVGILLADSSGITVPLRDLRWPGAGPISVPNLRPGSYLLGVAPAGSDGVWSETWFDGASDAAAATAIRIERPGQTVAITIRLEPRGTAGAKSSR